MGKTKQCKKCRRFLEAKFFWKDKYKKDGLRYLCIDCDKARQQEYVKLNKKKISKYHREWSKNNKEKIKRAKFLRKGISLEDIPKNCEICNSNKIICYDHDHKTGKFRGWICDRCNRVLGAVKDDPIILLKMIEYLKGKL